MSRLCRRLTKIPDLHPYFIDVTIRIVDVQQFSF
jgi:hypothetical protein